jgi:hypothetical protein
MAWTLLPIDRGPDPTDAELAHFVRKSGKNLPSDIEHELARCSWRIHKRKLDPDAFVVPFVEDDKAYNKYRKSIAWQKIRERVIGTARGLCRCCGRRAQEVHHRDYRPRVLAGNDDGALIAICSDCHRKIHFDDSGTRRVSWDDNERVLAELVARNSIPA